jgi:transcriptional regulator with XRE-family HTH domain
VEEHKYFAIALMRMLVERGWTQSYFAEKVGIRQSQISNYLHCRSLPNYHFLKRIKKVLECEYKDLFEE